MAKWQGFSLEIFEGNGKRLWNMCSGSASRAHKGHHIFNCVLLRPVLFQERKETYRSCSRKVLRSHSSIVCIQHTHTHTHTCTHAYIYTHICIHIHKYMYTHIHTRIYIHTHTYIYTNIHAHMHICIHICIHIHIYIYTYIFTHIYTHKHTHTHIFTHKHNTHTHTHTPHTVHSYQLCWTESAIEEGFRFLSFLASFRYCLETRQEWVPLALSHLERCTAKYYSPPHPQPEQNGSCLGAEVVWSCGRKDINMWMENRAFRSLPTSQNWKWMHFFPITATTPLGRICLHNNKLANLLGLEDGSVWCCTLAEPEEDKPKAHGSQNTGLHRSEPTVFSSWFALQMEPTLQAFVAGTRLA